MGLSVDRVFMVFRIGVGDIAVFRFMVLLLFSAGLLFYWNWLKFWFWFFHLVILNKNGRPHHLFITSADTYGIISRHTNRRNLVWFPSRNGELFYSASHPG